MVFLQLVNSLDEWVTAVIEINPLRLRPIINAELLPVLLSRASSELVIQNVGLSVAKRIRVTFEPAITEDLGDIAAFLARRYSHTIPTMGPGRMIAICTTRS